MLFRRRGVVAVRAAAASACRRYARMLSAAEAGPAARHAARGCRAIPKCARSVTATRRAARLLQAAAWATSCLPRGDGDGRWVPSRGAAALAFAARRSIGPTALSMEEPWPSTLRPSGACTSSLAQRLPNATLISVVTNPRSEPRTGARWSSIPPVVRLASATGSAAQHARARASQLQRERSRAARQITRR